MEKEIIIIKRCGFVYIKGLREPIYNKENNRVLGYFELGKTHVFEDAYQEFMHSLN